MVKPRLGLVINQDAYNLPFVQKGMNSEGYPGLWLGDQELRIRHFHKTLEDYLDGVYEQTEIDCQELRWPFNKAKTSSSGAYRQMKTIREFEERLHKEIMTGEIAGFNAFVLRSGSRCSRRVRTPRRKRSDRLYPSRPRALHRQGLRRQRHDGGDLWTRAQGSAKARAGPCTLPTLTRVCSAPMALSSLADHWRLARRCRQNSMGEGPCRDFFWRRRIS